ncbi:NRAMP family divalent metal transporter [Streptomyces gamaensis]|uniref:NRAMP family divalent metal transporter n=1 Tax=Streptomyces gamaensis TaxID=1763542 RepID=A0ABW0ZAW1_9ACTN
MLQDEVILGALGSVRVLGDGRRRGWPTVLKVLLAVLGPGLIAMVNDAAAFGTYTQAGQDYGTALLWTMVLLIPVLYVNQEMVVRLGAVTGVGHARLIRQRFGRLWCFFCVTDLLLVNALTVMTEFIGVCLAVGYLGFPRPVSVCVATVVVLAAATTGSFRRFERIAITLCAASLLLVPVGIMVHPSASAMATGLLGPGLPGGAELSDVLLLTIGIIGAAVTPWQLFFQQSYVVDKRITPRFLRYGKADLCVGIATTVVGGLAVMGCAAAAFAGRPGAGGYTDAGAVARGLEQYAGRATGVLFAVALLAGSVIGACAVSLSTAYTLGDALGWRHSLHHGPRQARAFHLVIAVLAVVSAIVVLTPGMPLGVIAEGVQALAGVLLPSASVFLLLLCNDRALLGPWVNTRAQNAVAALAVAVLAVLSLVLTVAVAFPGLSAMALVAVLASASAVALLLAGAYALARRSHARTAAVPAPPPAVTVAREEWRTPALHTLPPPGLSPGRRLALIVLRAYLASAVVLVVVKTVQLALRH